MIHLFAWSVLVAQNSDQIYFETKVTYSVDIIGDSTNLDKTYNEDCLLFINDKLSLSESKNQFVDPTSNDEDILNRLTKGVRHLTWTILKSEEDITVYDSFSSILEEKGNIRFSYKEPNLLEWTIMDDTMTISGLPCQKATTNYGGRQWEAWFTLDVPVSSGPYKFGGLPGLIISISDTKKHWNFVMKEIEKKPSGYIVPVEIFKTFAKTTKEDFFKNKRYYVTNYMEISEASGIDFINAENRAIIKRNVDMGFKSRSNWIELYP